MKHLHALARADYLEWVQLGRNRESEAFQKMTISKHNFKSALNECVLNDLQERSISVEEKFRDKNMKSFWKSIHSMKNKIKQSNLIDGQTNVKKHTKSVH